MKHLRAIARHPHPAQSMSISSLLGIISQVFVIFSEFFAQKEAQEAR